MAFSAKFEDKDYGWDKWSKALRFLGGKQSKMEVGLLEGITDPDVIFRGAINEIGDGMHLPERPWFRTVMDERGPYYLKKLGEWYVEAMESGLPGGDADIKRKLAEIIVEDLAESIDEGNWRPNADSTVRKKGFDHPLVETGELRVSPTYKIIPPGGK